MTAEEIDIVVNASVEKAVKEFQKLLPSIKKQLLGIKKEFDNTKFKEITAKVNVGQIKEQMKKAKKEIKDAFDPNDISGMTIDGKAFKIKNISGYSKEIQKLKGKMLSNPKANIETMIPKKQSNTIQQPINTEKLSVGTNMLRKYYAILDMVKLKMSQLKQEINQTATTQNKLGSFFSTFKQKTEQVKNNISNMKNSFKGLPKVTQNIYNNIKGMGAGLKSGLGNVLKYATALFSLRSIYSALSSSANAWLSSQNAQAKQLSANIEYMKYAMGSVFASVLEYVTNLVYSLMKAVQSLVYAFSGVNIFAKATASSMKNASGSAKQTSKSLSSIHSEINNVSENKSSGSGAPNIDLSNIDNQMSPLSQKLYDFFKPLVDSWNTYGQSLVEQIKVTAGQIGELVSTVWKSVENIITNGTIYSMLESILSIIGNIAEAFSNAWKNNENGDKIIQNLADTFKNLLEIIEKITQSSVFQWILTVGVSAVEKLTKAVEWVTQKLNEFVAFLTGSENDLDGWAILIGSIATAIGLVVAALVLYNVVAGIAAVVTTVLTSPITLVVLAIAALIAIIVLCVKHWDTIKATMINVATTIKEKVVNAFNYMKEKVINIFNKIKTTITNIWNNIWTGIKNIINKILGGIESFVNGTIRGINKLLSGISKVASAVGSLIGLSPINLQIRTISLPRLAKGGVLTEATTVLAGEYSGAKTNPEIVTPQNIMRETFEDVLSNYNNENSDRPINIAIYVGNAKLGQILLDNLRDMKRQSGKDIEALVGG